MFARNLIFCGSQSGEGKSTLTANLAWLSLRQGRKVLIVTNEEHPTDVLNRIACLNKGWAYHDHTQITEEQRKYFDDMYPVLLQRVEIIHDQYNGIGGLTTTIEGINTVLNSLKQSKNKYDIILIDYFQNINTSHKNPTASGFEVLHNIGRTLDQFKNVYNAPIILLGTLKSVKEGDTTPFKERIEGRKSIYNFATCCIEIKADKKNSRSDWTFHKSRFARAMGKTVSTGFDKGRYVPYSMEFAQEMERQNLKKELTEIGVKDAKKLQEALGIVSRSSDEQADE
jgi:MinD-like ATPase involved in chromosome partitioning or flagellar assembly